MSTTTWSKTETKRRLTVGAKAARKACRQRHNNTRVEVGIRLIPTNTLTPPVTKAEAYALCYPDGDDLAHHYYRDQCHGLVGPGDVVHLYVSEPVQYIGDEPYLDDIVVVWLGVGEHEPRVIDPRFVSFEGEAVLR
jgi:hypothetical protein